MPARASSEKDPPLLNEHAGSNVAVFMLWLVFLAFFSFLLLVTAHNA